MVRVWFRIPKQSARKSAMSVCEYCNLRCATKGSLKRHALNVHKVHLTGPKYECDECSEKFFTLQELKSHHISEHDFQPAHHHHKFPTMAAFRSWKEKVEKVTRSRYIIITSARKGNPQGKEITYFGCHRSGKFVPQGTGKKKYPPSLKCGRRCFAGMTVTKSNTEINVVFQSKHRGHDFDIRHLHLSKTERASIAAKLQEGVSLDAVLDSARQNLDGPLQRLNLLTRQDLYNIMRDNVDNHKRLQTNNYVGAELWGEQMHTEKDNPVLFFKRQGQPDRAEILDRPPDSRLEEKDFMLAIMTAPQEELFRRLGTNRVCVDGLHGTTGFDFQLVMVLCVDEFGAGFPVAYCITNRTDQKAMTTFFASIRSKAGQIPANVFMTDNAPSFYDAWSEVMGPPQHQMLCECHVDENWCESINKYMQDKIPKAFSNKDCNDKETIEDIISKLCSLNEPKENGSTARTKDSDCVTMLQAIMDHLQKPTVEAQAASWLKPVLSKILRKLDSISPLVTDTSVTSSLSSNKKIKNQHRSCSNKRKAVTTCQRMAKASLVDQKIISDSLSNSNTQEYHTGIDHSYAMHSGCNSTSKQ